MSHPDAGVTEELTTAVGHSRSGWYRLTLTFSWF